MKFLLDNWYLIALALVSGAMLFIPGLRGRAAADFIHFFFVEFCHDFFLLTSICFFIS